MSENLDSDCSPVKLSSLPILEAKPNLCLVCRQWKNETLSNPRQQGISTFVKTLKAEGVCHGYPARHFLPWFNFETKTATYEGQKNVRWHLSCYRSYTKHYKAAEGEDLEAPKSTVSTRSQSSSFDFEKCCIICGFGKHKKISEKKIIKKQSIVDDIKSLSEERHDDVLRNRIGWDFSQLIKRCARYHHNCYLDYKYIAKSKDEKEEGKVNVYDTAFEKLVTELNIKLSDGRAIKITQLLVRFKILLKDEMCPDYDSYTTQKLKSKISRHYGATVTISDHSNSEQYIFSSRVSVFDALNVANDYKRLLKAQELMTVEHCDDNILKKAAQILSNELDDVQGINDSPFDPADVSKTKVKSMVPARLQEFLIRLCKFESQDEKETKCLTIAQDIIYNKSKGRKKTPKHTALAISLKSVERSKEFITYLNRLGLCISYDEVLRIETKWAEGMLEIDGGGYTVTPSNISEGSFAQGAFDNGDYGQEKSSQHVTNSVLYQYGNGTFSDAPTTRIPCSSSKSRRRSIEINNTELEPFREERETTIPRKYAQRLINLSRKTSEALATSTTKSLVWILVRHLSTRIAEVEVNNFTQLVPGWTGFRKILTVKVTFPTIIGHCRTIPKKPTDKVVVYNAIKNIRTILYNIGQTDPCITVDESIYELAKEIQWQDPSLDDVTIRLGGFHRAKNFLGILGKRMNSSGFDEILEESEVFKKSQVEGVIEARHYYRGIEAHTLMVEAMWRLFWEEFVEWLTREDYLFRLGNLNMFLEELHSEFDGKEMNYPRVKEKYTEVATLYDNLKPLIEHFVTIGKAQSPTFKFWYEYCQMVFLLLDFLAAERDADWEIHLETFQKMLYYDAAYDHYKYLKWGLVYLHDMLDLPITHPDLYSHFLNGQHVVSRKTVESSFNCVSTDMALEQSLNKDTKTKGGIVGVTHDVNAVEKWTLTAHLKAAVRSNFRDLCNVTTESSENFFSRKVIENEEKSVQEIYNTIVRHTNPFTLSSCEKKHPLKNIVTAHIVTSKENVDQIVDAFEFGKKEAEKFIETRLIDHSTPFFAKITKLNLHTFLGENKPMKISRKKEPLVILKDEKILFSRLLTASIQRQIDLKNVFSHELSAVPLSLFRPTGEMRKTDKSKALHELESEAKSVDLLSNNEDSRSTTATVIDFMATIHSIKKTNLKTFDDLFNRIEDDVLSVLRENLVIAIVPDRYDVKDSIKTEERMKRIANNSSCPVIDINDITKLPTHIKRYFSNAENKTNLVNYCFDRWKTSLPLKMEESQVVYLAELDGSTTKITTQESLPTDLQCDHEEADSRMLVFCKMIDKNHDIKRMIIQSPDTDVAVISCYHQVKSLNMKEFWFKTGRGTQRRFLPIHEIVTKLDPRMCMLLLAFHSITGCDTVSSFAHIGKKTAFAVLKSRFSVLSNLKEFGNHAVLSLDDDAVVAAIRYVCLLYDQRTDSFNINDIRYKLFTKKCISGERLPPTLDALTLHLRRANYQTHIWMHACTPILNLPSPIGNGWVYDENTNEIIFDAMCNTSIPEEIVELTHCGCKTGCDSNRCRCKKYDLKCIDACLCGDTCMNKESDEDL